ncbi:immunoglobulin-like domain-containing protein [Flavobacterium sp. B11]|uniref:immunoglobulin-like domain-containing protein n=1 Tax=Flavobacterium movens TaxID=214860 RepID=UPI0031DB4044
MKNIFIKLTVMVFCSMLFIACDTDSTGNVSRVTNYPIIEINGANTVFTPIGTAFTDPGVVAKEAGAIIPTIVTYSGNFRGAKTLDINQADEYTQTYTATNKDGFKTNSTRKVIVYKTGDLVNSIEGVYLSTTTRNGTLLPASQGSSVDQKYIYIWKNSNGTYGVSDAFGGWYSIGRNIGITSATQGGTISGTISTNTFTFPGGILSNQYFGGTASITKLTVNAGSKTLVLTTNWTASDGTPYSFVSTLTQVQF